MKTLDIDLEQAFLLRHDMFVKAGIIDQDGEEKEYDHYDFLPTTKHVGVVVNGVLRAYARLISCRHGFPASDHLGLFETMIVRNARKPFEISRLCVSSSAKDHMVLAHALRAVALASFDSDTEILVTFTSKIALNAMERYGVVFPYQGMDIDYCGVRQICIGNLVELAAGLVNTQDDDEIQAGYLK